MENLPDRPVDTVRLVLALFDPDEHSFPEFSYSQLIENKVGFYPNWISLHLKLFCIIRVCIILTCLYLRDHVSFL